MEEIKIVEETKKLLFNDALPILEDISIDEVTEELISVVPGLGKVAKVAVSVRNQFLMKKLVRFINKINTGECNEREKEKRRRAAQNNEKWFDEEVENVIIYLDRYENTIKADMAASLYLRFVNSEDNYEEFLDNMTILDRLFLKDFKNIVDNAAYNEEETTSDLDSEAQKRITFNFDYKADINNERLVAIGLLERMQTIIKLKMDVPDYKITDKGKIFAKIILNLETPR